MTWKYTMNAKEKGGMAFWEERRVMSRWFSDPSVGKQEEGRVEKTSVEAIRK
jgi:hypothetical protein